MFCLLAQRISLLDETVEIAAVDLVQVPFGKAAKISPIDLIQVPLLSAEAKSPAQSIEQNKTKYNAVRLSNVSPSLINCTVQ